ncbi:HipA N-terminal domain-containing protein [Runella slithyformis]|uniref:HipA N-terminal domain protein n=1 Tax=Runella slithyformis (strain ATCC 29530 / DSM 19594 / LMG 11500 / NCIMB 11436 / LSU 4) TaxID=761193 RepID=A0A7U3ZRM0_RUNSL|nr:HipA N-terminal domain-containing protein [Runella slithyformis]AEI52107.1 HipA N-terminal domain protein [Runella slithyformis DSM 19594]
MRKATVYLNQEAVGELTESSDGFIFRYDDNYIARPNARALSLTMPISQQKFKSSYLFPFFYGLLSEGYNRAVQCRLLKIDENDDFGLLLAIAHTDTVGAVRVIEQTKNLTFEA